MKNGVIHPPLKKEHLDPPLIGSYRPTSKFPLTAKILEKPAALTETSLGQLREYQMMMQSDDGYCSVLDLIFSSHSAQQVLGWCIRIWLGAVLFIPV